MMRRKFLFAIIFFLPVSIFAQTTTTNNRSSMFSANDTTISTPFFAAAAGWTFPFGDLGDEFKSFVNFNANLGWKTTSNWMFILDFGFQFGSNNVKNMDQMLSNLMTNDRNSFIIGSDGTDAGVVGYNRNLSLCLQVGKIFPVWGSNPNSGLLVMLSGGLLQHQIVFEFSQSKAFQIDGDYKYGYDRQKRGPMFGLFLGYIHLSKKYYANWYAGLQYNVAWTKMTRDVQFDMYDPVSQTFLPTDKTYNDHMITLKLGWMIPFFGRSADKIYYY